MRCLAPLLRCLALVALALLPACTSASSQSGSSSTPPIVQRPATPVTLTLWHSWSGAELNALNSLARSFEQVNPDVRIRLESRAAPELLRQYSMSVADESAPQLLLTLGRYVAGLAEQQYVAPLDAAFDTSVLTDVLPQALDSARVDGQLFGMPITFDTLVLFYDQRRVAAPPATFNDVFQLNLGLRDLPPEQRPFSLGYHLMLESTLPYLEAWGGTVVDANAQPIFTTTSKDATIRWLQWLGELQKNQDVIASADFSAIDGAVESGRALSAIDWSHRRANYARVWDTADAVGVAPLPQVQAGQPAKSLLLSQVLCINTVTSLQQRAAAYNFIRFMVERSSQETLASRGELLPVNLQAQVTPELQTYLDVAKQSQALVSAINQNAVWRPLNEMFRAVISGATPASDAVEAANSTLQLQTP